MTKTKHIRKEFNSFEEFNKFISDLAEGKIDIEEMEKEGKAPRSTSHHTQTTQPKQQPKQESGLFDGLRMYYNPNKQVFTILGPDGKRAMVRRHKGDSEDVEKAMLYCLLKYHGVHPSEIWGHYKDIKIQDKSSKKSKQSGTKSE